MIIIDQPWLRVLSGSPMWLGFWLGVNHFGRWIFCAAWFSAHCRLILRYTRRLRSRRLVFAQLSILIGRWTVVAYRLCEYKFCTEPSYGARCNDSVQDCWLGIVHSIGVDFWMRRMSGEINGEGRPGRGLVSTLTNFWKQFRLATLTDLSCSMLAFMFKLKFLIACDSTWVIFLPIWLQFDMGTFDLRRYINVVLPARTMYHVASLHVANSNQAMLLHVFIGSRI